MSLYDDFFYSSEVNQLFSEKETIAFMLTVEAELAAAQASTGLISIENAAYIKQACNVDFIDIPKLKKEIRLGGNAAIPLVQQLMKIVKNSNFEASKYVHYGATSQDIIDTASVLQIKVFINWLNQKIEVLVNELVRLTSTHKGTLMIGRTLLQQAKPITFGLKTAAWLESICRIKESLKESERRLLVLQMAGAVGSQNVNLSHEVVSKLAESLELNTSFSWQSNRDSFSLFACNLGVLSGSLGKIATDISLLMQTEIAEVFEGCALGKGGSSTMPHKRNPVTCSAILANSKRTPGLVSTMLASMNQEHERSAGGWHAEWEVLTQLMMLVGGSIEKSIELIAGLEVDKNRMLQNLEITKGLIYAENVAFALTNTLGKSAAHELVEKACKTALEKKMHLKDILEENKIEISNLDELFKPEKSKGNSIEIVEEILRETQSRFKG
jgi:3-carboxy-cis,cis-muconate cycloisomerase